MALSGGLLNDAKLDVVFVEPVDESGLGEGSARGEDTATEGNNTHQLVYNILISMII